MSEATPTADGIVPFEVHARRGRCPSCEHEARATARIGWFARTRPATCRVSDGVEDPSGWPTECGCTDAFHGS